MAKLKNSFIEEAKVGQDIQKNVFDYTLSSFITDSTPLMKGYLDRLNKYRMNNYYSVKILENLYNYTEKI